VIHPIKSDWGLRPANVLQGRQAYGVDHSACKFGLASGLVEGRPAVDQHDRLFFREGCGSLSRYVTFGLLALCEAPHGHVGLHQSAFFKLVPDEVRKDGEGCLKKFLKVISRLSCLGLEIPLSDDDKFLIESLASLSLSPSSSLVIVMTRWGHHFGPFLLPLALFFASLPATLGGAPRPSPGTAFPLPWINTTSTASSREVCQVEMSSSSFMVFGWSRLSSCMRVRQLVPDQNVEMTPASQILGSLWHFWDKH
jgi:hypothetical protein